MGKKVAWDTYGDHPTGSPPPGWTKQVEEETLVSDEVVTDAGQPGGKAHEIQTDAATDGEIVYTMDVFGDGSTIEMLGLLKTNNTTGEQFKLVGRLEEVGGVKAYYKVSVQNGDMLVISSVKGANYIVIDETAFAWSANTYYWVRVQMATQTIRAKIWQDGTSEPGDWTLVGQMVSGEEPSWEAELFSPSGPTSGAIGLRVTPSNGYIVAIYSTGSYCWDTAELSLEGSTTAADRPAAGDSNNCGIDDDALYYRAANGGITELVKYDLPDFGTTKATDGDYDTPLVSVSAGNYVLHSPWEYGLIGTNKSDMTRAWTNLWYGPYNCCTVGPNSEDWTDPCNPESGTTYDGSYVWAISWGRHCTPSPCATAIDYGWYLLGVDPSDGSIDYFYDVSSSFKHMDDNWSVASVVAYDETNNCLIITGTAYNSGTYYRQHIGKFDLTTKTMTGVLEDTYWTTNYHDQHQVSPNGKFWYRYNSEEDGTGDDYLNCLDIATMTVEHSKKLADLDVGSGKQVTKISYWTEVDSESGAFFARPTAGTGLNSQDLLKISVSGISSEFLRSNGKPGWGGKGKGSTVTITYFSVAEKTEPPPPNGNSGFEEWGNPFAWVGPGRIGRMPHRLGKGIK